MKTKDDTHCIFHNGNRGNAVVGVQHAVLRWARETIGLSLELVAEKMKQPIEKIVSWECGESLPTYSQMETLAYEIYKRPLAIFFFPAPPEEPTPQKEFRTLPTEEMHEFLPDTHVKIRQARAYQLSLEEIFDSDNPSKKMIWKEIRLALNNKDIITQATAIRSFLEISVKEQKSWKAEDIALKHWRKAVESVGIFVFKDAFKQKTISGLCLMDDEFPLIYINNSTTKTRQIFSLMHELAHLLLGESSLSKFDDAPSHSISAHRRTERFCNEIASQILLPSSDFEKAVNSYFDSHDAIDDSATEKFASLYSVSREVILRRLFAMEYIDADYYEKSVKSLYNNSFSVGSDSSGGNYYLTKNSYLSDRFKSEVLKKYYSQRITLELAADYLGVKAKGFHDLEARIAQATAI